MNDRTKHNIHNLSRLTFTKVDKDFEYRITPTVLVNNQLLAQYIIEEQCLNFLWPEDAPGANIFDYESNVRSRFIKKSLIQEIIKAGCENLKSKITKIYFPPSDTLFTLPADRTKIVPVIFYEEVSRDDVYIIGKCRDYDCNILLEPRGKCMEHTAVYLWGDDGRKELLGADELVPDQQRIKAIDIDKGFNGYYTYHLKEV